MSAIISQVVGVRPHGDSLSIITINNGQEVVANRLEDGSFRWTPGEMVVYLSEGSIVPDDVMQARGYWDAEKNRGGLEGNKRNRVKMRRMAGFESRGLLFKIEDGQITRGPERLDVVMGQDVSDFFGLVEHQAG